MAYIRIPRCIDVCSGRGDAHEVRVLGKSQWTVLQITRKTTTCGVSCGIMRLAPMGEKPKHRPFLLNQNLLHMDKAIIDRLEYVEETYAGEIETWKDPVTGDYYHVPLTILRDWENMEKL